MATRKLEIGGHVIEEGGPVFAIAEIGLNHNGCLQTAKRLIDAAFACGWHCVKFQKRTPELCVPEHQKAVPRDTPWGRMTYLEYRHKVEFGREEYDYIDRYCREKPILWTASVWDAPSLEFILGYDVPLIKLPSPKITDLALLRKACAAGKPVVMSTGMSTLREIDRAVAVLEKGARGGYVLMHTNSAYPAPLEDLNLHAIRSLRERYRCLVGYSGHEYDLEPTVIAVSLGAPMIERHVTLDHSLWGSDHAASLEVHAMDMLFKRLKNVRVMMGDGVKKVSARELEIRKKLRGR